MCEPFSEKGVDVHMNVGTGTSRQTYKQLEIFVLRK